LEASAVGSALRREAVYKPAHDEARNDRQNKQLADAFPETHPNVGKRFGGCGSIFRYAWGDSEQFCEDGESFLQLEKKEATQGK